MALDEQLTREARPTIRLFQWNPPAMSFGWKQPHPPWFNAASWMAGGLEAVERPTGGGIAFHGSDVSIAVIVPRAMESPLDRLMQMICDSATRVCGVFGVEAAVAFNVPQRQRVTYCLTQPSPYAVFVGTRKLAGFAIRRYPQSWLIQGSLLVRPIPPALRERLPADVARDVAARAIPLADAAQGSVSEADVAAAWAAEWSAGGSQVMLEEAAAVA